MKRHPEIHKWPRNEGNVPYYRSYGHMLGILCIKIAALVRSGHFRALWKANLKAYDFNRDVIGEFLLEDI